MQTKYKVLIIIGAIIALLIFVFGFLGSPLMISGFWAPYVQKTVKENFIFSFIIIIIISFCLSFSTNYLTRRVTDVKRLKRYQEEVNKWKQQESTAKKLSEEGNPNARKLMIKVGRKKKYIEKLQRNMATERLKPSLFTFVPYILLFIILSRFVFLTYPVAIFPFNMGKVPVLGTFFAFLGRMGVPNPITNGVIFYYYGWYTVCLFTFNMFLQRVMGTRVQ